MLRPDFSPHRVYRAFLDFHEEEILDIFQLFEENLSDGKGDLQRFCRFCFNNTSKPTPRRALSEVFAGPSPEPCPGQASRQ